MPRVPELSQVVIGADGSIRPAIRPATSIWEMPL